MEKKEKKTSVLLYTDWARPLKSLPLEEVGRLFFGILEYTQTGQEPRFESPGTAMAWAFIRMRLEDNLEKWDATRQKRREAGRHGAAITNGKERQKPAKPANAVFAEPEAANPAVPVPELVPVPVPVPGAAKAAGEFSPDGGPLPPPSSEPEKKLLPEAQWVALGLGKKTGPAIKGIIQAYREAGIEDGLIVQAMREAAEYQVKAPAAYLRTILDRLQSEGVTTLSAWQAGRRGPGGAKRVDRESPSGSDFLADALTRPRRHKRKGCSG